MTTSATRFRPRCSRHVLGVIKLHVETFFEARWKALERRIAALRVRMTNQAHRYRRRCELPAMAIRARFVTGKPGRRGVVGAFMTGNAGNRAMPGTAMEKLGVVSLGALDRGGPQQTQI